MRYIVIVVVALLAPGCALFQAPPEIQVLKPVAGKEIKHYQRKMGGVAKSTTAAWKRSETTRIKDDHWRELKDFHAKNPAAFTPTYVKAQTILLLVKLNKIDDSADGVMIEVDKVNIHIDRAIQILDLFNEWMTTGFEKGDAAAIKKFFEESSEKWLEMEKDKMLIELDKKVSELEGALEAAKEEGGED